MSDHENEAADTEKIDGSDHQHEIKIQIDRVHYTVHAERMDGAELRQVPTPPIGPDRDLFEVLPGEPDRKIENGTFYKIRNGARFFTAPAHINPGKAGLIG